MSEVQKYVDIVSYVMNREVPICTTEQCKIRRRRERSLASSRGKSAVRSLVGRSVAAPLRIPLPRSLSLSVSSFPHSVFIFCSPSRRDVRPPPFSSIPMSEREREREREAELKKLITYMDRAAAVISNRNRNRASDFGFGFHSSLDKV